MSFLPAVLALILGSFFILKAWAVDFFFIYLLLLLLFFFFLGGGGLGGFEAFKGLSSSLRWLKLWGNHGPCTVSRRVAGCSSLSA